jgi:hypothetical protein
MRGSGPENRNVVRLELAVVSYERRAFDERLRDEHAVERVGMVWRKCAHALGVRGCYGQRAEVLSSTMDEND